MSGLMRQTSNDLHQNFRSEYGKFDRRVEGRLPKTHVRK